MHISPSLFSCLSLSLYLSISISINASFSFLLVSIIHLTACSAAVHQFTSLFVCLFSHCLSAFMRPCHGWRFMAAFSSAVCPHQYLPLYLDASQYSVGQQSVSWSVGQ